MHACSAACSRERLEDVLLGGGLALIGTVVAFPRSAPEEGHEREEDRAARC